jgi:hypothetical protein
MAGDVARAFVDECHTRQGPLRDAMVRVSQLPAFSGLFGGNPLDRPWFVARDEIEGFASDACALFELVVSLPQRLFDGNVDRYCAALGIPEHRAALLRRCARGRPALLGRADAYHDGESYRLLELNLGSELGGMNLAETNRALLDLPEFQSFARRHQLGYVDTAARLATMLRHEAEAVTLGAEPTVALIEDSGDLAPYAVWHTALQNALRRHGIELILGELHEVRTRAGKVVLRGTPIDVVLRYFTVDAILQHPQGARRVEPVLRAHEEGRTVLVTTFESGLFANKAALALLSERRSRSVFSAEELALIDRILPWTRSLGHDTDADLLTYCQEHRADLILKPRAGHGGRDIFVGWETSEADWAQALRQATERGYVAQRRVRPRPEPVYNLATGAVEDWAAVLGVFLTESGYSGAFARALPVSESSVIAWTANRRTRIAGVFLHPDSERV